MVDAFSAAMHLCNFTDQKTWGKYRADESSFPGALISMFAMKHTHTLVKFEDRECKGY
jgi:hypothetical protein